MEAFLHDLCNVCDALAAVILLDKQGVPQAATLNAFTGVIDSCTMMTLVKQRLPQPSKDPAAVLQTTSDAASSTQRRSLSAALLRP